MKNNQTHEQQELDLQFPPIIIDYQEETKMVKHTYRYAIIDGVKYGLTDLFETLEEVHDSVITNEEMVKMLKKYDVITRNGSQTWMHGCSKGKRYDEFYEQISNLYYGEE